MKGVQAKLRLQVQAEGVAAGAVEVASLVKGEGKTQVEQLFFTHIAAAGVV